MKEINNKNNFCRIYDPRCSGVAANLIDFAKICGVRDTSYRLGRGRHVTRFSGKGIIELDGIKLSFTGNCPAGSPSRIFSDGFLEVKIINFEENADSEIIRWITSDLRDRR